MFIPDMFISFGLGGEPFSVTKVAGRVLRILVKIFNMRVSLVLGGEFGSTNSADCVLWLLMDIPDVLLHFVLVTERL